MSFVSQSFHQIKISCNILSVNLELNALRQNINDKMIWEKENLNNRENIIE